MPVSKRIDVVAENGFYCEVVCEILRDIYAGTELRLTDLDRDISTVRRRSVSRGLPFLTRDLPSLGKAVMRSLETESLSLPSTFGCYKDTKLPAFMRGVFRLIYHDDGVLLPEPDPFAIQEILQVAMVAYKLEIPSTDAQEDSVLQAFVDSELEIRELALPSSLSSDGRVLDLAAGLLADVLGGFDPQEIVPRHGPGAVSTGEKYNAKYYFDAAYEGLNRLYPFSTYFTGGGSWEQVMGPDRSARLEHRQHGEAKIVFVPKDSRGPRLISCEPCALQWVQGGLNKALVKLIESHPLTKGYVNFTRQDVNQQLALSSSRDGSMATLDLKEASDRISMALVERIWPESLIPYLRATRSQSTLVPEGHVEKFGRSILLHKFAPMGSSLCFPVLSLTLWAVVTALAITKQAHTPWYHPESCEFGWSEARSCRVYVYGDDLIVPTGVASDVVDLLPKLGLRINADKSYIRPESRFRESCGMDAFNGVQVTPLRMKALWGSTRTRMSANALASYTSLSNSFFRKGYWNVSNFLARSIEGRLGHRLPYGTSTSAYPNISIDDPHVAQTLNREICPRRWNADLQRWEYKVKVLQIKEKRSLIVGWARLLKNFSVMAHPGDEPEYGRIPWSPLTRERAKDNDWAQRVVDARSLTTATRYEAV